jgi:hypothetical protein
MHVFICSGAAREMFEEEVLGRELAVEKNRQSVEIYRSRFLGDDI